MSLQIFILGTLSEGEHHPYDIKKMVLKPLDNNIAINDGTLYYHFDILAKKGLIQKIKVIQSENRPEKTTYGITDAGRKALEEEIYAIFQNFTTIQSLYSSLLFLDKIDKSKLAYLIEEAIAKREKDIHRIEQANPEFPGIPPEQRDPVRLITEHAYQSIKCDINWLQQLLIHLRG
ncbi:PadR family transcriptional regulator [Paenibacillus nasutitermitis]|uniref:Transcription regulator PadR N-terminal domain-containing protein n=1 Tax=Paenibacillus nasutitermitis TaxID=1652958 RepID=A0A916ZCX5_9BACL|nr:PadR family transcriptional regulator [Paenibacillus nasutitermitis]GGD89453.1 hypothetical protein GCM10010911_55070 [Paenibacillus nasutitermitis]